jgi:hypothetical protein
VAFAKIRSTVKVTEDYCVIGLDKVSIAFDASIQRVEVVASS